MFTLNNGAVERHLELSNDEAPPRVKHGDDTWDAQDKIFRHVEDHLHRHLEHVAKEALEFAKKEKIAGVLIGGHRPLFSKIEKQLKYPLSKKVIGTFVTELKVPQEEVFKRVKKLVEKMEIKKIEDRLQQALL